jgi:hypothetical protein
MSSSLCHVRHCPPFLVASVPLDAISDYSSLYTFLCFSLFFSLCFPFKFFVRLFLFCSFVALLSPSKISTLPFAQSRSTTAYTLLQRARDPKFLSDLFRS